VWGIYCKHGTVSRYPMPSCCSWEKSSQMKLLIAEVCGLHRTADGNCKRPEGWCTFYQDSDVFVFPFGK